MSLARFMELFQGRGDAFAEQQEDGTYRPIRRPITKADYIAHGKGEHTYGIYTVQPASLPFQDGNYPVDVTKLIAWDIDTFDVSVRSAITAVLDEYYVDFLIEESGRKGWHIWLFLDQWHPASVAYKAGRAVLQRAKVNVECYPKQPEVTDLGNLIKLPLGVHRVTGKRSKFYESKPGNWTTVQPVSELALRGMALDYKEPPRPDPREAPRFEGQALPPCMQRVLGSGVSAGKRDEALFSLALECKKRGQGEDDALATCFAANDKFEPPLPEYVVRQKVRSAYQGPYRGLKCENSFLHDPNELLCSTNCWRHVGHDWLATQDGEPSRGQARTSVRFSEGDEVTLRVEGKLRRDDGRTALVLFHPDAHNQPVMVV